MLTWIKIAVVVAFALPGIALRFAGIHLAPPVAIVVFGAGVAAASFLLVWSAEAAQRDISSSLATALLALIAVLPEYAVDLYFAWSAGHIPQNAHYAAANMTGSNRLLLGLGWPLVVALFAWGAWRRGQCVRGIHLGRGRTVDIAFLGAASLYSLIIPFTRRIALYDSLVLLALFGVYLWRAARGERVEPELVGVAKEVGHLPQRSRRIAVVAMFLLSALIVMLASAPFAQALVAGGKSLGFDEFLLVQWLAPLASESPELLVAAVLALRGHQDASLGTLLSSKVNQWTLLVGSLPVAYALGGGSLGGILLDARQTEEFVLTAAQTLLGFALLIDLRFGSWEAFALFILFALQFLFPSTDARFAFAAAYAVIALVLMVRRRGAIPGIVRAGVARRT
jgi:cation:H+ antiporter